MPEKSWDLVYDEVMDLHKSVISLGKSVTSIEEKVDALSVRMDSLEGKVDALSERVDSLEGKVNALSVRMDSLEGKVNLGFVSLRNEMNIRFDRIDERSGKMERENTMLKIRTFDVENDIRILKESRM